MKKFNDFREEMMTTGDVNIPKDTKNMKDKKKRKTQTLTRNYIEVLGKRKKLIK